MGAPPVPHGSCAAVGTFPEPNAAGGAGCWPCWAGFGWSPQVSTFRFRAAEAALLACWGLLRHLGSLPAQVWADVVDLELEDAAVLAFAGGVVPLD